MCDEILPALHNPLHTSVNAFNDALHPRNTHLQLLLQSLASGSLCLESIAQRGSVPLRPVALQHHLSAGAGPASQMPNMGCNFWK